MRLFDVHEDILRHLWGGQYLDAHRLTTADGRHLVVLEPGMLNRDSGPDFRGGVISLDGVLYRGDIEFHRTVADWKLHSHHTDEKYNSVILNVVYASAPPGAVTTSASGRSIPILCIEKFLSSPLEKILEHAMRDEHASRVAPLKCAGRNDHVDPEFLREWITDLAMNRMKAKAVSMLTRLSEIAEEAQDVDVPGRAPWQQLLYEGLMDGLGYSRNRIPFVTLAQRVSVPFIKKLSTRQELSVMELEALLFAVSGLQLDIQQTKDQDAKVHLHQLHFARRSLCERIGTSPLPPDGALCASDWVFSPTRPSNFPTARIAAGSELLGRIVYRGLLSSLLRVVGDETLSASDALQQLLALLSIDEDPFWSFHYGFAESSPRAHLLLGETRSCEIIINTILPLFSLYALVSEQPLLHERAVRIAAEIPPVEDNAVLRKMKKQLLKTKFQISTAAQQQGLLQLHERYCSAGRCSECRVGTIISGE